MSTNFSSLSSSVGFFGPVFEYMVCDSMAHGKEEYLNSEKGQAEVADAITTAFKKYKDEIEK